MLVLLYGITDVKRFTCMYMLEKLAHIERYAVEYLSGSIVDELQLYVLQMLANELARAEVQNTGF